MANWKIRINVADIWQRYNEKEDFDSFKEDIVPVLESYIEKLYNILDEDEAMAYEDFVQQIKYADDVEDFDYIWQSLYDWADVNRVWIETF